MHKGLQFKMIVFFSILTTIACIAISFLIYQSSTTLVKDSVGKQAVNIVKQSVRIVETNSYETISANLEKNSDYYELRKQLNSIRKMNGLDYLYTMGRKKTEKGYEYYYVVDGMPLNKKDSSDLGEVEKGINDYPLIKKTFNSGKIQIEMTNTKQYGGSLSAYIPIKSSSGKIIGILGADINVNHVYEAMDQNRIKILIITIAILLASILFVSLFSMYLTKPLKQLTSKVKLVGLGDLAVDFQTNRTDEIGVLTKEFQQMINNLKSVINGINQHSNILKNTVNHLTESTTDILSASQQITSSLQEIASGAEIQNRGSEEIAISMESMSSGVQQIAVSSMSAAGISSSTLLEAEQGKEKIKNILLHMTEINHSAEETERAIRSLEKRSTKISHIIKVISDISSQTNLLALNAAIEAARAGEHGKGFAVVANEVRKLADESDQSAKEISRLIETIFIETNRSVDTMNVVTKDTKLGISIVEEAGIAFNSIFDLIQNLVGQIQEVSSASEELSASAEQIYSETNKTAKISQMATNNTHSAATASEQQDNHVNEMAETIHSLSQMANDLNELIKQFRV